MDTEQLIRQVIQCIYNVQHKLTAGFLEIVYRNALYIGLKKNQLPLETEVPIEIYYDDVVVGNYRADMIVGGRIIIEIKAVQALCQAHEVQLVNYLTATKIDNGLLVNFGGERIEIKRKYRLYKNNIK